jgi:hypothetical protein
MDSSTIYYHCLLVCPRHAILTGLVSFSGDYMYVLNRNGTGYVLPFLAGTLHDEQHSVILIILLFYFCYLFCYFIYSYLFCYFLISHVIERKTLHDLAGSWRDGRFLSQIANMADVLKKYPFFHLYYLLEGALPIHSFDSILIVRFLEELRTAVHESRIW